LLSVEFCNPNFAYRVDSVEFSPNSNVLYLSVGSSSPIEGLPPTIRRVDLSNMNTAMLTNNGDYFDGIQLAMDGRIYVVGRLNGAANNLFVITNPNDTVNPMDLNTSFTLNHISSSYLPQWVWQECCLPTLTLTSPVNDMDNNSNDIYSLRERELWIKASNHITAGNNTFQDGVVYHAGNFVELNSGFEADYESQFAAYIQGCSGNYVYKANGEYGNGDELPIDSNYESNSVNLIKNKITIYTNQTNSSFTVSYNNSKFNQVKITSIDGRVVYNQKVDATNSYQLDISNFRNGIYSLSVVTVDGTIITQKLVKN